MGVGETLGKGDGDEFAHVEDAYNRATSADLKALRVRLLGGENICDARAATVLAGHPRLTTDYLNVIKERWYGKAGTNQWIEKVNGARQAIMDIDLPGEIHYQYTEGTIGMLDLKIANPNWSCSIWGQCYHRVPFYHLTATGDSSSGLITLVIFVPDNEHTFWKNAGVETAIPSLAARVGSVELGPKSPKEFKRVDVGAPITPIIAGIFNHTEIRTPAGR